MLWVLLASLCCAISVTKATSCDPATFLCSGRCPPLPEGTLLPPGAVLCMRDTDSGACVCWLNNPSAQLHSLFQCDAVINGTKSKVVCRPPSHCFPADADRLSCLIVTHCPCLDLGPWQESDGPWRPLRATVHSASSGDKRHLEDRVVEKVQGDVREFSLKHLLFLIGFVIAPLFCWCLLNFFHEGKCRKKPPPLPEAQPIPISRSATVDCGGDVDDADSTSQHMSRSVSVTIPTAPDACDLPPDSTRKGESPPPYDESMEQTYVADTGPPPSYDDAMLGSEISAQQVWRTLFVNPLETRENV